MPDTIVTERNKPRFEELFCSALCLGLRCTAFAKSLTFLALDGFDLITAHKLSSNEKISLRKYIGQDSNPGPLGAKREHYPLCYAAPQFSSLT